MISINVNSRLHITLLSMIDGLYRKNGGIGFAIKNPSSKIDFSLSNKTQIINNGRHLNSLDKTLSDLIVSICNELELKNGLEINVSGNMQSHHGFGSGTAVTLACIEALLILNNIPYNNKTLVRLSGRGGTSGVGVHSYFTGGFILDIGHNNRNDNQLIPSHIANKPSSPLLISQEIMPNWSIGLCIPKDIPSLSQKEERDFFNKTCPINKTDAFETSYHAIFGCLAAVKEQDYEVFCQSLKNIQECHWKNSERNLHGERLSFYEQELYKSGADVVAMSSLGPALFFLSKDIDAVIENTKHLPCELFQTQVANQGRVITNV